MESPGININGDDDFSYPHVYEPRGTDQFDFKEESPNNIYANTKYYTDEPPKELNGDIPNSLKDVKWNTSPSMDLPEELEEEGNLYFKLILLHVYEY